MANHWAHPFPRVERDERDDEETEAETRISDRPTPLIPVPDIVPYVPSSHPSDRPTDVDSIPPNHRVTEAPIVRSPSWLRRLAHAILRLIRPPPRPLALPTLPPPSRTKTLLSPAGELSSAVYDELLRWLWLLDATKLECMRDLIQHILAVRQLGGQAARVAHVRFVISREVPDRDGTIAVERIRDKLFGHARGAVDSALFGLAAAGEIDLIEMDASKEFDLRDPWLVDGDGRRFDRVRVLWG